MKDTSKFTDAVQVHAPLFIGTPKHDSSVTEMERLAEASCFLFEVIAKKMHKK